MCGPLLLVINLAYGIVADAVLDGVLSLPCASTLVT
jgi:hypothetical protein